MDEINQSRLEAIVNNAIDAIITIDESGRVEALNPATVKMFGFEAEEVIGQNVKLLMPSPYQEEHDSYLQRYLETGVRKIIGIGREVVGRKKDGTEFPMHLAVSEFVDGDRRLFTGVVRDISDLKEAESKLREINESLEDRVQQRTAELNAAQAMLVQKEKLATLGQVSGGIAHEIRNPLNAVKTSVYFLANAKHLSDDKIHEHLERIDRQVTLIDNVVTALTDVAKLPTPVRNSIDVSSFVSPIVRSVAMPEQIRVEMDLPEQLSRILIDENQVAIVLRNLLRNAREAMPDGGQITIRAQRSGDMLRMSITDEGMGMEPEQLARSTEPFYTTKARGIGLGLAISTTIMKRNGGKIEMASEPNVGSCFTLFFQTADDLSK